MDTDIRHTAVINELAFQRNQYADACAALSGEIATLREQATASETRWNDVDAIRARWLELIEKKA